MGGGGRRGMTKTEIKNSFDDFLVGDELTDGWWDKSRAVETVVEAQARAEKVAEQLWARARGRGGIGGECWKIQLLRVVVVGVVVLWL